MDARWKRAEEIFNAAVELPQAERGPFLDQACVGDDKLRREVESLLTHDDPSDPFVEAAVAAAAITQRLPVGQMVGPYRVTGVLGEGGMGVVYKAQDTRLDRTVALKLVKIGFSERFEREARAVSALNHPHIATLYDIGNHEGVPYLVLEHVQGKPLKGPLQLPAALDCAIQVANAVEAAHAVGIVHRDLKPANILFVPQSGVKILDFGLARQTRRSTGDVSQTLAGVVAGTAAFMSPEQAEGREVDTRSDIFSFGCVLYELISGRPAFQGKSVASVIAALLEREPEPLTAIPAELHQVLCRCLRKDPARRWQHMGDVRLALEDVKAAVEHGPTNAAKPGRRWRLALASLAAVAMAATGYLTWKGSRIAPEAPRQLFTQVTDDAGQEVNPSLSPDGKTILYSSRATGNWDIYLLRVGGKNPVNLTKDSAFDDTQPAFSSDGERIAFRSERDGGGLFVMGATGESVRRLTSFCYLPAWSPDAKEIACSTVSPSRPDVREVISSQLFVIDVENGNRRLVSGGVMDAVQPSWSPDGRRIAFWGLREGARDIFTVSRDGQDVTSLTDDEALDWDPVWAPEGKYVYFSSDRGGSMNIWRVPVEAVSGKRKGEPQPLNVPSTYATGISLSHDGQRLAYMTCLRSSNLYRAEFDPSHEAMAGPAKPVTQGIKETLYPSLSRDGAWLAFTLQGLHEDIVVTRPEGSQMRRITDDSARDRAPRWSPDGSQIAFMSNRSGRFEIWTIHSDGSGLRQMTDASPRGGVTYPAWSPDGRRMSYNLPDEMGYIIEAGRPWKDQQPQLVRAQLPDRSWFWVNDWSHDGARLAGTVQRMDGGTFGIAVYSIESGKLEQVTEFGQLPRWLPDGRRLLFQDRGRIYLADMTSKRAKEIVAVPEGTINPYFDVSWDGSTIVFSVEAMESDIWLMSPG
jgi:eukaryotic-like serine/threonine-protein kinase